MNDRARATLEKYLKDGEALTDTADIKRWDTRVTLFLEKALGAEAAKDFHSIYSGSNWYDGLAMQLGHIEGLLAVDASPASITGLDSNAIIVSQRDAMHSIALTPRRGERKVFLVHGRDNEAKETVARFLEKLELKPVILHEQPNEGRTIIEKFEVSSSDVAFAVVLLTPDDHGAVMEPMGEMGERVVLHRRARQNVIMELGYFMGRLGRSRVSALYKGELVLPSDYQGVVYTEMDAAGGWKTKLAQELVEAKLPINLDGLIAR